MVFRRKQWSARPFSCEVGPPYETRNAVDDVPLCAPSGRSLGTPTVSFFFLRNIYAPGRAVAGQLPAVTGQPLSVNSQIPLVNSQPLSVDLSTAAGDEPTTIVWRPARPFFRPQTFGHPEFFLFSFFFFLFC